MLSSVFKLPSSSFKLFSNNVLLISALFQSLFLIFNCKFSNFIFQKFPFLLRIFGLEAKNLEIVIFQEQFRVFRNCKNLEIPETMTIDTISVFQNQNSNWRLIS